MLFRNVFVAVVLSMGSGGTAWARHTAPPSPGDFMMISSTLAHVTDSYFLPSQKYPEFILIQDVHKHPQVQSDIAALIVQAYRFWGVRKVFLEGAFTTVDLSMFQTIPQETRVALLNRLVEQGDLSGPELAAVQISEDDMKDDSSADTFQLIGMEDPQIYRQNLAAYQAVLMHRTDASQALEDVRRTQDAMHLPEPNPLSLQLARTDLLLHLKLTPSDYDDYIEDKEASPSSPELDPLVQSAERFYRLVNQRSEVFLDEALTKVPAATGPRLIVVGGFHTVRMAQRLKDSGHSYVVLAPHITEAGFEGLYEKHMLESINALQIIRPFADLVPQVAKK